MQLFRLVRKKHAEQLSGRGAALYGARWNSAGTELIYTATSRALAMAEVAVHLSFDDLPEDFLMMEIQSPEGVIPEVVTDLPEDWNTFPHATGTQLLGDRFVSNGMHLLLLVPSVVVKGDWNVLINPKHPDFSKVHISGVEPFPFDRRFFKA